jgi:filamentous hemagglutinin family protein
MRAEKRTKLSRFCWISGSLLIGAFWGDALPAIAQIIPDSTLPENSVVNSDRNNFQIDGGTTRGANLFHSFDEFSIPTGGNVFFNNARSIQTIFSRITGNSISNIDGAIAANGFANLFLINPNGIIFGRNAQLQIGGSFFATTANRVGFEDGSFFETDPVIENPILTVSLPSQLQFENNSATIINRSQVRPDGLPPNSIGAPLGLAVAPGRSLGLLGGNLSFQNGNLTAFEGQIELGSAIDGTIDLTPNSGGFSFNYNGVRQFGNIELFQNSIVDASGAPPRSPMDEPGSGGAIQARGDRLIVENSGITSSTYGSLPGRDLTFKARDIEISGFLELPTPPNLPPNAPFNPFFAAGLFGQTEGNGNAANLRVEADRLRLQNGGQISTSTFAAGRGGDLEIRAGEIEISGFSIAGLSSITSIVEPIPDAPILATGNAGNIEITSDRLSITEGGTISAATSAIGNAGNITIANSEVLEISGVATNPEGGFARSRIATFVTPIATGNAGNIQIISKFLRLGDRAEITALTTTDVSGGQIDINVEDLSILGGAQVSVNTVGSGRGGNLNVTSSETIELVGTDATGIPSGLFSQSQPFPIFDPQSGEQIGENSTNQGDAGDISVTTDRLIVREGAAISADTFTDGRGGSVTVNANESVTVTGRSAFPLQQPRPSQDADGFLPSRITVVTGNSGDAGGLQIESEELTIAERGKVAVDAASGGGSAGDLTVITPKLRLDTGRLTAETASGEGGDIIVRSRSIFLRRQSQLSTTAGTADFPGNGGNIDLDTEIIAALENSDISSNAFEGRGGVIGISAQGIFGLEVRSREELDRLFDGDLSQFDPTTDLPETSDLTAISRTDPTLSGEIGLNTPDIDPNRGTVEFEEEIVDVAGLIDRDPCRLARGSEYLETGKGGIPQSPGDRLDPIAPWEDWSLTDELPENRSDSPPNPEDRSSHLPQQANAIERSETGEYRLISTTSAIDRPSPFLSPACPPFVPTKTLDPTDSPATAVTAVTLPVREFAIENSSAFTPDELAKIGAAYRDRSLTLAELDAVRSQLEQLYRDRGYLGTFAVIPPQTVRNGIVTVQVLENRLDKIDIQAIDRDRSAYTKYIENRLGLQSGDLLNRDRLLEALYTLQFDPRIESLSAELSEGVRPQTSFLTIRVREANPWRSQLSLDNGRAPSVGSFRRQAQLSQYNPLGLAGLATVNYANTDGSNTWDFAYTLPVNSRNGSLSFLYSRGASEIVEKPFNELDIEADSRNYEITYRQPVLQAIASRNPDLPLSEARDLVRTEIALGLTASRRESQTSILGVDFPLSPGAESDGETRISALRFFQEALRQDNRQIFAARSEFSLGLGVFDATTHDDGPDSRFFAWRGQAQWVRRLQDNPAPGRRAPLLLVRGDVQLSTSALLPLEQFGIGGSNSVRGYRQDSLLTDNGVLASVELQYPLWSFPRLGGSLSLIPFVDFGVGWNWDEGDRPQSDRNTLISTGLGLQLQLSNKFQARLDWGLPLIEIDSRERTWQENGVHFSVNFTPF